ncbi:PDZ and LIM domain protein 3-like [Festucalex cinctus]
MPPKRPPACTLEVCACFFTHAPPSPLSAVSAGVVVKESSMTTHKAIEVTGPGGKATIIHAQYNTPISMYSQDAIMDAIAGQTMTKGHDAG